jgi:hypothetical protein
MITLKLNNSSLAHAPPIPFNVEEDKLSHIEGAILKTVAYADVFDYPLKANEIHRYLIEYPAERGEVMDALKGRRLVPDYIERQGDYYLLRGRERVLAARSRRAGFAKTLWPIAEHYGQVIARLPFVRMVAVTGSLAMNNVEDRPDIDYLVVAQPGRVWVCRAGIVLLVRWVSFIGVILCPNYILSARSMGLLQQNLYTAHELAQMIPVAGNDVYNQLRESNSWTEHYLPNAWGWPGSASPTRDQPQSRLSRAAERFLGSGPGDWLENWEMQRKIAKLQRQHPQQAESDFCPEWCKGHFENHGQKAMAAYKSRLNSLANPGNHGGG